MRVIFVIGRESNRRYITDDFKVEGGYCKLNQTSEQLSSYYTTNELTLMRNNGGNMRNKLVL